MNKTKMEAASREQLNRFIDDLRKELVLNRMQVAESARQVKSLMSRLEAAESSAESLRSNLAERDQLEAQLRSEFEKHVLIKEAELARIRQLVAEKDASIRSLSRIPEPVQDNSGLVAELEDINRSLAAEMEARLAEKTRQLEKLQSMVEKKEMLLEKLSAEFRGHLAAKDSQIKSLNGLLRKNTLDFSSAEKYRSLARISEDASRLASEENAGLKSELAEAQKAIAMRDSAIRDEAARFAEFSAELGRKSDERIQELVKEFSEKEIALKIELETVRARAAEQEIEASAKQKEIDLAIDSFVSVSQKVLSFKTPDAMAAYREKEVSDLKKLLDQRAEQLSIKEAELKGVLQDIAVRERALSGRERELNSLLRKAEEKADLVAGSESEIRRSEKILLLQQQAFQKQMAMLEEIGYEFKELKPKVEMKEPAPIMSQKVEEVLVQKPLKQELTVPVQQSPRILKILKPKPFILKETIEAPVPPAVPVGLSSEPVKIPAQGIEVKAPHELFGRDRDGFPEMEELVSMIEVARSHGDSDEAIKASLVASGYDLEKVELAFRKI